MTEESRSIHSSALPNHQKAVIAREKLEEYVLNPNHNEGKHKARLFKSILGFYQKDWETLKQRILDELPYQQAFLKSQGRFGRKYEVTLPILGLNSQTEDVISIWIIKPESDYPSLVTIYPIKNEAK